MLVLEDSLILAMQPHSEEVSKSFIRDHDTAQNDDLTNKLHNGARFLGHWMLYRLETAVDVSVPKLV